MVAAGKLQSQQSSALPCARATVVTDGIVARSSALARGAHYFDCGDRLEFHADADVCNGPTLWMPLPLRQNTHWLTDVVELGAPDELMPRTPREVLGRARVVTPAGAFEDAVLIETSEPAHGDTLARAVRRTYYAANVGPVLVLVPEPDGRWVADLVLESIVVPPPAVPPKAQP